MAKQMTIKQISELSGVSPGTVDRILHNRDKVSKEARAKVEAVLAKADYRCNIHTSALSLRKSFSIAVVCPTIIKGDYWHSIRAGIDKAQEEYSDIELSVQYFEYDQYDTESCKRAFNQLLDSGCSAVIIGGTFEEETVSLCSSLDKKSTPYVFIDTRFDGCHQVGHFTADQYKCGKVMGKLLDLLALAEERICVIRLARTGSSHSFNTGERLKGLQDYFSSCAGRKFPEEFTLNLSSQENNKEQFIEWLRGNRDISTLAVLNSKGHSVADLLRSNGISDRHIVGFDATDENIRCLHEGTISFLLCQHPEQQGFESLQRLIAYLLYRSPANSGDTGPVGVEILTTEML